MIVIDYAFGGEKCKVAQTLCDSKVASSRLAQNGKGGQGGKLAPVAVETFEMFDSGEGLPETIEMYCKLVFASSGALPFYIIFQRGMRWCWACGWRDWPLTWMKMNQGHSVCWGPNLAKQPRQWRPPRCAWRMQSSFSLARHVFAKYMTTLSQEGWKYSWPPRASSKPIMSWKYNCQIEISWTSEYLRNLSLQKFAQSVTAIEGKVRFRPSWVQRSTCKHTLLVHTSLARKVPSQHGDEKRFRHWKILKVWTWSCLLFHVVRLIFMFASALAWFCWEICSAWLIHPWLYLFSCSGCNPFQKCHHWTYRIF